LVNSILQFLHAHRENEELYIFVSGRGQMIVDEAVLEVREGTVVRVAPAGARAWRNTGTEELHIVVQAKAGTMKEGATSDGYSVNGAPKWNDKQVAADPEL
jgi:mannose-6-phosphate isomerase-like protein (cupin superfamily)